MNRFKDHMVRRTSVGDRTTATARRWVVAGLLAASIAFPEFASANLLQDSSFESAGAANYFMPGVQGANPVTLNGWTFSGSSGITTWDPAYTGAASAYVNALIFGVSGSVEQAIQTVAGHSYLVDFWLAGNCCAGGQVSASFGDTVGYSQNFPYGGGGFGFTEYSFVALATDQVSTFRLSGTALAGTFFLDDVSVTDLAPNAAVPEPASLALLGFGLAGLGFSRRRKQKAA